MIQGMLTIALTFYGISICISVIRIIIGPSLPGPYRCFRYGWCDTRILHSYYICYDDNHCIFRSYLDFSYPGFYQYHCLLKIY